MLCFCLPLLPFFILNICYCKFFGVDASSASYLQMWNWEIAPEWDLVPCEVVTPADVNMDWLHLKASIFRNCMANVWCCICWANIFFLCCSTYLFIALFILRQDSYCLHPNLLQIKEPKNHLTPPFKSDAAVVLWQLGQICSREGLGPWPPHWWMEVEKSRQVEGCFVCLFVGLPLWILLC